MREGLGFRVQGRVAGEEAGFPCENVCLIKRALGIF
jgi:hypothetical protein